jgi:hypothetical protein
MSVANNQLAPAHFQVIYQKRFFRECLLQIFRVVFKSMYNRSDDLSALPKLLIFEDLYKRLRVGILSLFCHRVASIINDYTCVRWSCNICRYEVVERVPMLQSILQNRSLMISFICRYVVVAVNPHIKNCPVCGCTFRDITCS